MNDVHVDRDLSAYLDGELAPGDDSRVRAHLGACGRCSARLGELRATASLIAALPGARPARSLVPAVAGRWNWLRPARSLSAFASGAFLFLFLLTAVGQSGTDLGGGPTSPFGAPAAVPAAGTALEAQRSEDKAAGAVAASASPVTQFAPVPAAPTSIGGENVRPLTAEDSAREQRVREQGPLSYPPFWLALALTAAVAAVALHWRLRTT